LEDLVYLLVMGPVDREILEAVAEGRMSPDEAAVLLEQARGGPGAEWPATPAPDASSRPPREPRPGDNFIGDFTGGSDAGVPGTEPRVTGVRITAAARTVRIIGDPSVTEAEIDGRHRAWRDGDTLNISGGDDVGGEGFSFRSRRRSYRDWRDWPEMAEWRRITGPLIVRVNPLLAVEAELSAGSLSVLGMHGPVAADLAAGSARLEAVSGPLDVTTRAGSVRIQGRLASGTSRIRCDAGSVTIRLDPGSSVRVRARVELGRVRLHGEGGDLSGACDVVVGGGEGLLDIEAAMASVDITTSDPVMNSPVGR
jgi:hypothetical protein